MTSLAYKLGRKAAPHFLRARWVGVSLVGSASERIRCERAMGACLAREFQRSVRVVEKGWGTGALTVVTERLAGRLTSREHRFHVRAMEHPQPNALAFPGGFIFVSLSLLDLCGFREDELAFLLAHEMAHVVRGHAASRFFADGAVRVAGMIARASRAGAASRSLAGLVAKAVQQSYSRTRELEADRFAVHLTASARFDPGAGERLLGKLRRSSGEPLPAGGFFLSHPAFDERIQAVRGEMQRLKGATPA